MTQPADLLQALDPEQREVAETLRGPVRVLAGAGTGKTRAITHRIAHGVATGVYAPTEVLAVTFTTRAAGEMRGRLRRLGAGTVQARTFHSAALRQLRYFWPHVHGTELPTLTESKIAMIVAAARRHRLNTDQAMLRDLASEVEWAKVSNVHPDDYARLARERGRSVASTDAETVGRVFGSYEEVKRGQGRMDMEDVLLLTAGMLADDERVAAQVRRQYNGSSSTSSRTSLRCSRRCSTSGWVGATSSAWWGTPPRPSTRSRAPSCLPHRLPGQIPQHHVHRAGPQLPLDSAGRRGRQPPAGRHDQPQRRAEGATAGRSRGDLHRAARRGRRGTGSGRPDY